MNEVYDVVGIKQITTKRGTIGTNLYLITPFSSYEFDNSNSCDGMKVQSEYVSGTVSCSVGDKVILVFSRGFEGKAVVSGVQVLPKK